MARQTSVDTYANKATAGMRSSNGNYFIDTKVNGSVKKDTVTVTAANLATTATVNGTGYTYDSKTVTVTSVNLATTATVNGTGYTVNVGAATLSKAEIAALLIIAINAGETLAVASLGGTETVIVKSVVGTITVVGTTNCSVAQTSQSTTVIATGLVVILNAQESSITATSDAAIITIVSDTVGTTYTLAATTNCTTAVVNANAAAIAFGLFVSSDANDEDMAMLPSVAADITSRRALGISEYTQTREQSDEGWKINADINYVRRGTVWAVAEEAILISDTVYIRHTANGTGKTVIGSVRTDDDSSTAAALAGCSVLQYDSTTGLVELDVNLPA